MGLTIGQLNAFLGLDDSEFNRGVDGAEGRFRGLGGKLGGLGKVAGVTAGAAVGAGMAAGIATNMELGAARARLEAQLGGTSVVSERAGQVAGSLYSDAYGASLDEVNQAVRSVVQNIGGMADASEADLQGVTAQVMSLSDAFGQDLGQTTRAVDQMIRTGLAGSAQEALDILAVGFQNGANEADDLLETMNEYGTQFRKMGMDGQTAMGLIQQGLAAGARDADVVADAMKEFSVRTVDGSKEAAESLTALGFNADEMRAKFARGGPEAAAAMDQVMDRLRGTEGQANAAELAFGLFGTKAEDLGAALYSLDPSAAADGLGEVAGAAQRTDEALMNTAGNTIESVKRQFQMLAAEATQLPGPLGTAAAAAMGMGPQFLSVLAPLAMMISAKKSAAAASAAAGTTMRTSVLKTAAVYIANATRMGAVALAQGARMAAGWVLAMGPVGWIIAAVIGLVALIIANWDSIVSWTTSAWSNVTNFVKRAALNIVSSVTGGVTSAYLAVVSWFGNAVSFVQSLPGRILSALGSLGGLLVGAGRSLVMGFWKGIKNAFSWVKGQFSNLLGSLRNLLPFSPAKEGPFSGRGYTTHSGRALMRDLGKGIASGEGQVHQAMAGALERTGGVLDKRTRLSGRMSKVRGGGEADAMYRAVRDALDGSRLSVDGRGTARLVNRQNRSDRRRGGGLAPALAR